MRRLLALTALAALAGLAPAQEKPVPRALTDAVSLYASFDEEARADFARGARDLDTRTNDPKAKGKFVFSKGFDRKVFRIAAGKGIAGGALEATNVLPDNGRIFFPARKNLGFARGGWGGAVSLWVDTDPDKMLKTKFCDPIQITQRGANDGGLWFDFDGAKPRNLRHGAFPAIPSGKKGAREDDPDAPMVWVRKVGWKAGTWHHVVLNWQNFDTGRPDARSELWIDGKLIGAVKDRPLAMDWDMDRAGIYVAINFIGLLDELAVFDRYLSPAEVRLLHEQPAAIGRAVKKR